MGAPGDLVGCWFENAFKHQLARRDHHRVPGTLASRASPIRPFIVRCHQALLQTKSYSPAPGYRADDALVDGTDGYRGDNRGVPKAKGIEHQVSATGESVHEWRAPTTGNYLLG